VKLPPSFSIRTLAIFVTLVCAYFGAWEATKRHAANQFRSNPFETGSETIYIVEATAPFPFIVRQKESVVLWNGPLRFYVQYKSKMLVHYYLWLFGLKVKLPVQGEWDGFTVRFG
jgi:hypothetical protein